MTYLEKRNMTLLARISFKRAAVFEMYENKCARCGFSDARALQIDHISGGGKVEQDKFGRNRDSKYSRVLKNPEKYQLLCANCNWIKRYENKEDGRPRTKRAA